MTSPLNLDEIERAARELLPQAIYDYYAGGADDEVTVEQNRAAFRRLSMRYRVLIDVSERDAATELLGSPVSMPVVLAPTALQRMAHPDGEIATARAAASAGTILTLSTLSSVSLEEVAEAAPGGHRWFQLYHYETREHTESLIARAVAAGYRAIVLTVDAPLLGRREKDLRNPFVIPEGVAAVHLGDGRPRAEAGASPLGKMIDQAMLTWADLAWMREAAQGVPVLLKGVVRGDDAKRALDEGVAGIWVSNHGGRQLDTSIPTVEALPEVVEVVQRRVPVIVDGGVRRGTDVCKALALGADAVALGRPQLWGLAVGGEGGVRLVLDLLAAELSLAMALAGVRTVGELDQSLIC